MSNPAIPIPNSPPLQETKWPVVIGVICIVMGSMGVLSSPMQFLSPLFTKMSLQVYVEQGNITGEQIDAHFAKWGSIQLILGIVVGFVSLCMLLGGIFLAKRKKKGALILKIWSILFIIYALSVPFLMSEMMTDQMTLQLAAQSGGEDMEQFEAIMGMVFKGVMAVSVLFWLALPIFFLIWFSKAKIKNEVQSWKP